MKKLQLFLLIFPVLSYGQNNVSVKNSTKVEGAKSTYSHAADKKTEGEGLKYLGSGIYTFQQTAPNALIDALKTEKVALEKVANYAKSENLNHTVTNIERQKVPVGFGVARCLVTFKLLNADGSVATSKLDKEKDKDVAKKKLLELKQLKEEGIITQEEYDKAAAPHKKILLGL